MTIEHAEAGTFAPLPTNPKVMGIVDRLTTAIAAGEFLPGSRLPSERALASVLEVGRNTVRQAIRELADRGLVETRLGRAGGAYVLDQALTDPSPEATAAVERVFGSRIAEIRDAVDAAGLVYALIAETAAIRRTPDDLLLIDAALDAFAAAVAGGDARDAQRADREFHLAVIAATGQPLLAEILERAVLRISVGTPQHIWGPREHHAAMHERALADHRGIVAAIRAQDRRAAYDLSLSHMQIDLGIILDLVGGERA